MDPHQGRLLGLYFTLFQGEVHLVVDGVAEGDEVELAKLGGQLALGHLLYRGLVLVAVFDEVGDGAELDAVLLGEQLQIRAARHGAVFVEDLDDDGRRLVTGQPGQIATGLGVAGTGQHATVLCHQREDVAGLHQIGGLGVRCDSRLHGDGAVGGGDAGGYPFGRFDGHGEGGGELGIVAIDHQRQRQLLATIPGQGQTDEPPAVTGHEVDIFRADTGGGHDEVPFVLPVFVIHQDHHLASLDIGNDFLGRA